MGRRSTEWPRLSHVREARRMTQEELAARAGVSPEQVCRLEAGRHRPYPRTLRRLADALGVGLLDLVEEGRDRP